MLPVTNRRRFLQGLAAGGATLARQNGSAGATEDVAPACRNVTCRFANADADTDGMNSA